LIERSPRPAQHRRPIRQPTGRTRDSIPPSQVSTCSASRLPAPGYSSEPISKRCSRSLPPRRRGRARRPVLLGRSFSQTKARLATPAGRDDPFAALQSSGPRDRARRHPWLCDSAAGSGRRTRTDSRRPAPRLVKGIAGSGAARQYDAAHRARCRLTPRLSHKPRRSAVRCGRSIWRGSAEGEAKSGSSAARRSGRLCAPHNSGDLCDNHRLKESWQRVYRSAQIAAI
jgi:hypothetical protein